LHLRNHSLEKTAHKNNQVHHVTTVDAETQTEALQHRALSNMKAAVCSHVEWNFSGTLEQFWPDALPNNNNNNNNNKVFIIKMSIATCYTVYKVIKMHNIQRHTNKAIHSLVYTKSTYI